MMFRTALKDSCGFDREIHGCYTPTHARRTRCDLITQGHLDASNISELEMKYLTKSSLIESGRLTFRR